MGRQGKEGRGLSSSSPRNTVLVEVNEEAKIGSLPLVEEVYSLVVNTIVSTVVVLLWDIDGSSLGGLDLLWRFGLLRFGRGRIGCSSSSG